jgi:regulator of protease activity HflC (stomatin/prohibitin superfamily)
MYVQPPIQSIGRGEVGIRLNQLTGVSTEVRDGAVLVLPGLHALRRFSLRDQLYRPTANNSASGAAPFQSVEGLSIGVDISVRYALDEAKLSAMALGLPDDINGEILEPVVQGVLYKTMARYTVREIFSGKRAEIQQVIEAELKPRLAKDGIKLEAVTLGKVDLPPDYKAGMEDLLTEELATEKMRYTLELKEKQVKQTELEAQADKVRRETSAQAAGEEQIIAAKAQAEAMKHVLPFKQKQIELKTTAMACADLEKYYQALDAALMRFHSIKMGEINKIVKEYWQQTYQVYKQANTPQHRAGNNPKPNPNNEPARTTQ